MPGDAPPTHQDIENARRRQQIADRQRAEYEAALALAEAVFGQGWEPCGRHCLVTHEEEERARAVGGKAEPAATVYSARKDGVMRHFTLVGGTPVECASCEDGFGSLLTEPDPVRGFHDKGGVFHYVHKHSLYWAGYEPDYRPKNAEQLAAARARREQKAEDKERKEIDALAEGSLFPEWVKEQAQDAKRGRKR